MTQVFMALTIFLNLNEGRRMRTIADRFLSRISKDANGCWNWTGSKVNGYGRIGIGLKVKYAHRASWLVFFGQIPDKLYVCHKCDNPSCVNPKHLFLGTAKDNMRDAALKGRIKIPKQSYASDESHQPAKLRDEDVRYIRQSKLSSTELAKRFNVSVTAISYARRGKTFRDVR